MGPITHNVRWQEFARQLERELAEAHRETQKICQQQADADAERDALPSATREFCPGWHRETDALYCEICGGEFRGPDGETKNG